MHGITYIKVSGYKSINQEQKIELRPLTLLAGANSSGKSSIMQPLLLLKQTLEARYDPGPLLLDGPNIKFTSFDQILSKSNTNKSSDDFTIAIGIHRFPEEYDEELEEEPKPFVADLKISFKKQESLGFDIKQMTYTADDYPSPIILRPEMNEQEIAALHPDKEKLEKEMKEFPRNNGQRLIIGRDRFYLVAKRNPNVSISLFKSSALIWAKDFPPASETFSPFINEVIHLPGLRGNPERTYPITAVGTAYQGTFENYVASIVTRWQVDKKEDKLAHLNADLNQLGLTGKIKATRINDTQVELQVGRLMQGQQSPRDMVNIADVGLGVSQTLPILVALQAAKPGQLVYLEQPEIHLHPRAQNAMANVLADAAKRGVQVVAETHSSLLLLGIQTLVAEGKLSPDLVKLHWFSRDENGATSIRSADLDESGAFGDWPEDFDDVTLDAQSRYLDAAESRQQRIH